MAWYDNIQKPNTGMMQMGMNMLQPRYPSGAAAPTTPFLGMQPMQQGGTGGMQPPASAGAGMPSPGQQSDPLDAYSDDDIARAYNKRQQRLRMGNKTYGGP